MIPLLTEHLWPWGLTFSFFLLAGIILFLQNRRLTTLLIWGSGAAVVLFSGIIAVYIIKTDRKEIKKTVYTVADAVKENNTKQVLRLIDPDSGKILIKAVRYLDEAKFETANITDYSILSFERTSIPPKAYVALNGTVRGSFDGGGISSPFVQIIHFESVELVKSPLDHQWRVTDNCKFHAPGLDDL